MTPASAGTTVDNDIPDVVVLDDPRERGDDTCRNRF